MEFITIENGIIVLLLSMVVCVMYNDYQDEQKSSLRNEVLKLWRQYLKGDVDAICTFDKLVYPFLETSGEYRFRYLPATECDVIDEGFVFRVRNAKGESVYEHFISFDHIPVEITNKYEFEFLKEKMLADFNKHLPLTPGYYNTKIKECSNAHSNENPVS